MKKQFLLVLLILAAATSSYAQSLNFSVKLTGKEVNLAGRPYMVVIQGKGMKETPVDVTSDGEYYFSAEAGDFFVIRNTNTHNVYQSIELTAAKAASTITVPLGTLDASVSQQSKSSISSSNYWMGASLAYNLEGGSSDDIIGGAKVVVNPSEIFGATDRSALNIIGNIGTFSSNTAKEQGKTALAKLAQSQSGLSLGLGYQYGWGKNRSSNGRSYPVIFEVTTNYRLNSFTDPKVDSLTIGLSQLRTTAMLEFSMTEWKNGGQLTLSLEGSMANFSKSTYNRIFGEERDHRFAFEATVIVPVSATMGFLANVVTAQSMKPVYQFGFTINTGR
jgi:hypothetical protein